MAIDNLTFCKELSRLGTLKLLLGHPLVRSSLRLASIGRQGYIDAVDINDARRINRPYINTVNVTDIIANNVWINLITSGWLMTSIPAKLAALSRA
jgi:hypothetical protein